MDSKPVTMRRQSSAEKRVASILADNGRNFHLGTTPDPTPYLKKIKLAKNDYIEEVKAHNETKRKLSIAEKRIIELQDENQKLSDELEDCTYQSYKFSRKINRLKSRKEDLKIQNRHLKQTYEERDQLVSEWKKMYFDLHTSNLKDEEETTYDEDIAKLEEADRKRSETTKQGGSSQRKKSICKKSRRRVM